jgi:hypothetical protein
MKFANHSHPLAWVMFAVFGGIGVYMLKTGLPGPGSIMLCIAVLFLAVRDDDKT